MLVISPYSRVNHVDSDLSDQASIINFIEYNWRLPGIPGSADQVLSKVDRSEGIPFDLAGMFDFQRPQADRLILSPVTCQPAVGRDRHRHSWSPHPRLTLLHGGRDLRVPAAGRLGPVAASRSGR